MVLLLALFLVPQTPAPAPAPKAPGGPARTAQETPPPPPPVVNWLRRHKYLRDMRMKARVVVDMTAPQESHLEGIFVLNDLTHFVVDWSVSLGTRPEGGAMIMNRNRFIADGTTLWKIFQFGETGNLRVEKADMTLLFQAKLRATQFTPALLDPLDLFFDIDPLLQGFKFEEAGRREEDGRKVVVFRGTPRNLRQLPGDWKRLYQAGGRELELHFDTRTGLMVFQEFRGADGPVQTLRILDSEFPGYLDPSQFQFEPPAGVPVVDLDPALKKIAQPPESAAPGDSQGSR